MYICQQIFIFYSLVQWSLVNSQNSNSTTKINNIIKDETTNKPTQENLGMKMTFNTTSPPLPLKPKSNTFINSKNKLRDYLLKNYDRVSHPVKNHTDPVIVEVGMAVLHLDMDEKKSIITVDSWMRMGWNDSALVWDPDKFDGVLTMHFESDELWKPDILLYNNADEANVTPYGKTNLIVKNTGEVLWVPPGHFKAYCKISLRMWPFDTQECTLKFGSWTSTGLEIDLEPYGNKTVVELLNVYTKDDEWNILGKPSVERNVMHYACCTEPYPDVSFKFRIQRDSPAYRAIIVLPCLVIMLMTGCSFLLSPAAGEKILINCIAILSAILYLLYFAITLPFKRTEVPIIVTFYSNITALVGIAVLLNVVCLSMARERKYSSPPKFLKRLFAGSLGKLLCLGNYYHQVSSTHHRLVLELSDMAESEQQTNNENDLENQESDGSGHDMRRSLSNANSQDAANSIIMRDWILVAAGLERLFFSIYAMAFAIITSVYV